MNFYFNFDNINLHALSWKIKYFSAVFNSNFSNFDINVNLWIIFDVAFLFQIEVNKQLKVLHLTQNWVVYFCFGTFFDNRKEEFLVISMVEDLINFLQHFYRVKIENSVAYYLLFVQNSHLPIFLPFRLIIFLSTRLLLTDVFVTKEYSFIGSFYSINSEFFRFSTHNIVCPSSPFFSGLLFLFDLPQSDS